MIQPCDTCGDSYKAKNRSRDAARSEAQTKANEEKEPFCVCEEAGSYFAASYRIALASGFHYVEIVSGLPGESGSVSRMLV